MQALEVRRVYEWGFVSSAPRRPVDTEFSMVARHEDGTEWVVPGFWAGGEVWRVRFAPQRSGKHSVRTVCSDSTESGLHGFESEFVAVDYAGDNPLLRKGPLRVAADRRHFEHEDGSPFLWLGDTWWKGLCKRLAWEGFQDYRPEWFAPFNRWSARELPPDGEPPRHDPLPDRLGGDPAAPERGHRGLRDLDLVFVL